MTNERLRNGLLAVGFTHAALAEQVDVDQKTVERWVTKGRMPHPQIRARVVQVLGQDETYFWPELLGTDQPILIATLLHAGEIAANIRSLGLTNPIMELPSFERGDGASV